MLTGTFWKKGKMECALAPVSALSSMSSVVSIVDLSMVNLISGCNSSNQLKCPSLPVIRMNPVLMMIKIFALVLPQLHPTNTSSDPFFPIDPCE